MNLKNIILKFINENFYNDLKQYEKLYDLAEKYDNFDEFVLKTDSLTNYYNILYRGEDSNFDFSDNTFFTDYVGHAKQYGDFVNGLIVDGKDILSFNDEIFDEMREHFDNITKKQLNQLYSSYIKNGIVTGEMEQDFLDKQGMLKFVYKILKSEIPFNKIQFNYHKTNLLIPIMLHYAKIKNKNIIMFLGGDYLEWGGQEEYVINDVSKYISLSYIYDGVH